MHEPDNLHNNETEKNAVNFKGLNNTNAAVE